MAMKPISVTPPTRYRRNAMRERIMKELLRRLRTKDWSFDTVDWKNVGREPLVDFFGGSQPDGDKLSLVDGNENLTINASASENTFEMDAEFVLYPGEDEDPKAALNNVCAELVEVLCKQHRLEEGGEGSGGERLSCSIFPRSYSPVPSAPRERRARAILTLEVKYRTATYRYFDHKP